MKRLFLIFFVMILIIGCADDIIIPKASELFGSYKGLYQIDSDAGPTREQYISWDFSDKQFWMVADRTDEKPQIFCDVTGFYEITDMMVLKDTVVAEQTCQHYEVPIGEFKMRRSGDSVLLKQYDTNIKAFKNIIVVKTAAE